MATGQWHYADHLHLAPDRTIPASHHSVFFSGQMLFLMPNRQYQSAEGTVLVEMKLVAEFSTTCEKVAVSWLEYQIPRKCRSLLIIKSMT